MLSKQLQRAMHEAETLLSDRLNKLNTPVNTQTQTPCTVVLTDQTNREKLSTVYINPATP